jgi:hypothetical protein
MARKKNKDEEDDGLVGRILLVLSPILIVALVVVIVCSLIATIIRIQETDGAMPFTYANLLSKAVTCNGVNSPPGLCLKGEVQEKKSKFTIIGWQKDEYGSKPLHKSIAGTVSFLDTMLGMFLQTIGDGLFDPQSKNKLLYMFHKEEPSPLGIGKSIIVVLKLAAIFFAFMFVLPIITPFSSIGGAILGVYLQSTILGNIVGVAIAILNIIFMAAWVPGFTALRLLGYGGGSDVKFGTVVKNFLKHYGWLIAFILIVSEVILAISLLGGNFPPIIAGATASALALLFFMIKDKKMFHKIIE